MKGLFIVIIILVIVGVFLFDDQIDNVVVGIAVYVVDDVDACFSDDCRWFSG